MKKENIEILNRIKPAIEKIIIDEVNDIYGEYKKQETLIKSYIEKIKKLEIENGQKDKNITSLRNENERLWKLYSLLSEDGVVKIINDGESYCDEYGNGGGYQVTFIEYKGENYEMYYDSF